MLKLRTFGGLQLHTGSGEPVDALAERTKCLALLAYLTVEAPDGRVPREKVANLLWTDRSSDRARASLRAALSQIRQASEPAPFVGKGTTSIGLAGDRVRADVTAFQVALEEGEESRALKLYTGDFLEGVHVDGARRFLRWADRQRGRCRQNAYEAALSVGASARAVGNLASAEEAFRRALDLGPLREEAARNLIQTLADRGRAADAVQLYEAFRERRAEELEMVPSEELRRMVEELKRAPRAAAAAAEEAEPTEEGALSEPGDSSGDRPAGSSPPGSPPTPDARTFPWPPFPRRISLGLLATIVLLGAAATGGWYLLAAGGEPEISEKTVAVLPFEVSGSGAEPWRDGMVTLLSTNLDGVGGLRAVPDRTVFATWQEIGPSGDGASARRALEVARQLGAEYALVGSAVQVAGELRLAAEIYETVSRDQLGQAVVRGGPDRVIPLTDSLTRRVLQVLLEQGGEGLPSVDLAGVTTHSLAALSAFLEGERQLRAGEPEAAAESFEAAVEKDSAFALAYARLGLSRWWSLATIGTEREQSAWDRALRLSEQLPRRERRLVRALHHSRVQGRDKLAADSLRSLTRDYPDDPFLWYSFGEVLFHGAVPRGWPEAERAFRRAVDLDPGNVLYFGHSAQLSIAVRHDSALASERIAAVPKKEWRTRLRIPFDLAFGDSVTRRDALVRLDSVSPSAIWVTGLYHPLKHPAERDVYEMMYERLAGREGVEEVFGDEKIARLLVANNLLQGQLQEGVSVLESDAPNPASTSCVLAYSMSVGIPVPDSVAASYLEPSNLGEAPSMRRLRCAAIYLIEQGREEEVDAVIEDMREAVEIGEGGTVPPGLRASLDEVWGYRAWRTGQLAEAVRLFSGPIGADDWSRTGAIWRGDLYRQMGELETAEGWYLAAWTNPVAHDRLGRLYEQRGEPAKATAAYRRFTAAWEEADPELQDRVEAARKRLEELIATEAETDE